MRACTEPAGTGIGAVCVARGGHTSPENVLNHTHTLTEKLKPRHATTLVRSVMKRLLFLGKPRKKNWRFALAHLIAIVDLNATAVPRAQTYQEYFRTREGTSVPYLSGLCTVNRQIMNGGFHAAGVKMPNA